MPLTPDEIEDGTGVSGALVYEDPETVAAWLSRRRKEAFAAADPDEQESALILATEAAEDEVRELVRCAPVSDGQGLIFPAIGAYDSTGRLLYEDELPEGYLEGIRLLAEEIAAGTFRPHAGGPPIEEERSKRGAIKYRPGVDLSSLATNHPEAWRKISSIVPPL